MYFEILDDISIGGTLSFGGPMPEMHRLNHRYGPGLWKKSYGTARVKLPDGTIKFAELHWYEKHGTEPKEYKIKRFVDALL
jgi:hypothetical protein